MKQCFLLFTENFADLRLQLYPCSTRAGSVGVPGQDGEEGSLMVRGLTRGALVPHPRACSSVGPGPPGPQARPQLGLMSWPYLDR